MQKVLLIIASAVLLFAGCHKELISRSECDGDTVKVTVNAQILNEEQTKASWDEDGNGACVDRWIMEVYDVQGNLYDRQVKTGQSGLSNTFTVILIKNQKYKFAFWADKEGSYNVESLKAVKTVSTVAGLDSRDAFFAEEDYASSASETITAKLYRPFAQINFVTLDLKRIYEQMDAAETESIYSKFIPKDFKLSCTTYNQFNVLDGTVSDPQDTELTLESCYADFSAHAAKTTIFMDYLFAGDVKELKSLKFTFNSNGVAIGYNFANIPLQRNYRTNISGNLMSNDATVNVDIIPIWEEPDYEYEVNPVLGADYVEIGGVKWATMNLGATTVAGSLATCAGDYYQWGSVNTLYNEIPWGTWSGGNFTITSWKDGKSSGFISDNREYTGTASILPDANDVVKQKVGNGWRMPTSDNFKALYDACINGEYDKTLYASTACGNATDFVKGIYWCGNYDGVAGCLFCDGTNRLFFPASGIGRECNINNPNVGGVYCSSTFAEEGTDGRVDTVNCLIFGKSSFNASNTGQVQFGFSIRPVKD